MTAARREAGPTLYESACPGLLSRYLLPMNRRVRVTASLQDVWLFLVLLFTLRHRDSPGESFMKHTPGFLAIVNDAKTRVKELHFREVKERLDAGEKFTLVDVREDNEWERGHLPGAIHLV